jgi:hypothetical protein
VIFGRRRKAVELLPELLLRSQGSGGKHDGLIFLKQIPEDRGQGNRPKRPPGKKAEQKKNGKQLDGRPLPNSHPLISTGGSLKTSRERLP